MRTPTILNMGIVEGNYSIAVMAGEINEQEREDIIAAVEGFDDGIDELERWMWRKKKKKKPPIGFSPGG